MLRIKRVLTFYFILFNVLMGSSMAISNRHLFDYAKAKMFVTDILLVPVVETIPQAELVEKYFQSIDGIDDPIYDTWKAMVREDLMAMYNPNTKRIIIANELVGRVREGAILHEFVHWLQDHLYGVITKQELKESEEAGNRKAFRELQAEKYQTDFLEGR